jgi:hypothetical protein
MAKTKTTGTKKLSRREMVVLLGSGAFVAAAEERAEGQAGPCVAVSPQKGKAGGNDVILYGDPCCRDSIALFLNGMTGVGNSAKANLKPLADALRANQKNLLEYSVMIWGLKKEERDALMKVYQERFAISRY